MIKPGTPVRGRDHEDNDWTLGERYYIGVSRSGVHLVEDAGGWRDVWAYVERMPRVLVKGDMVYVSEVRTPPTIKNQWIFDGMFDGLFMCYRKSDTRPTAWQHAIHAGDFDES